MSLREKLEMKIVELELQVKALTGKVPYKRFSELTSDKSQQHRLIAFKQSLQQLVVSQKMDAFDIHVKGADKSMSFEVLHELEEDTDAVKQSLFVAEAKKIGIVHCHESSLHTTLY